MHVAVGSRNPVKRAAVERALAALDREATVVAVGVDSGVSEQPRGTTETVEGAENRAVRALGERDLGVGLEGGVATVERAPGLYLTMWGAAADGERVEYGAGPRLRLPEGIAERVRAGEELGPVMDDVLGEANVAEKQGAAGALTAGMIDRERALAAAAAGAMGPFVTDL